MLRVLLAEGTAPKTLELRKATILGLSFHDHAMMRTRNWQKPHRVPEVRTSHPFVAAVVRSIINRPIAVRYDPRELRLGRIPDLGHSPGR